MTTHRVGLVLSLAAAYSEISNARDRMLALSEVTVETMTDVSLLHELEQIKLRASRASHVIGAEIHRLAERINRRPHL